MNQDRGIGRRVAFGRAVLALLLIGIAAACSRGDAAPKGRLIGVREKDFALATNVDHVHAGLVTFRVHNAGPSTHEFIVARTSLAADALPLQKGILLVDESSKQIHEVASLPEVRLGATRDLTVSLPPGHYVVFCNHDGHYRGGMYAPLEVTG